jgi:peptide/nickel transport system ATP-binding protein
MRLPPGCSFAPRCRWAVDRCQVERPELLDQAGARASACHRATEVLGAAHR